MCLRRARAREVLAKVPPQFHRPRISRLEARPDLHPRQAAIIEYIKANPDESYLLVGKNGVGKTHLGWALYRHAYAKGRKAVACSVQSLLMQYRQVEIQQRDPEGNVTKPAVIAEDLQYVERPNVPPLKWCLFLDEIEKARPSEFAAEMLFTLLKSAQEFEHQLIVTSNLHPERLIDHWGRIDEIWGTSIVRRLSGCTLIELF